MNDTNVLYTIADEMEAEGIIKREGTTLIREAGGRTYLVAITLFDITDWDKK